MQAPDQSDKGREQCVISCNTSMSGSPPVLDCAGLRLVAGAGRGVDVGLLLSIETNKERGLEVEHLATYAHLPLRLRTLLETLISAYLCWEAPHFHPDRANL